MILLAPLAGLIGALLTLPALLFFYLLRLRRRPLTVSSTMLWEQAAHDVQVNVPFRWIRPSLLLLLHLLILALFLLALARPAIMGGGGSARRAFFLIDVSASMQATDAERGASRLDAARERALELARRLGRAPGGCSITVIAFAHDAGIVAPPTDTLSSLRATLASVQATDQPGQLEPALRLAETLISRATNEDETPAPPMVVVFSDGELLDQKPLALAGAAVTFEPVRIAPAPDSGNVAIVACSASRDDDDLARARLFVRLQSTFTSPHPVALTVLVNGEEFSRHALIVPPQDSFGPGSIARTFDLVAPGSALITCATEGQDLLGADDAASVYLPPPVRPRLLLVHPDNGTSDPFLADALRELPLLSFRDVSLEAARAFAGQMRGQVDLVVYDRVTPDELPPVASMFVGARLPGEPRSDQPLPPGGHILSWDRGNVIMRDVSLDPVQIDEWLGPPPAEWARSVGRLTDLALVRDGAAIALLQAPRADHLLVRFDLAQSNWPLHFSFPVFLYNAVEQLTGAGASRTAQSYTTTQPVVVRALGEAETIVFEGPTDLRVAHPSRQPGPVSLGVLPRTGVWRSEQTEPPIVAVDLMNAQESRLLTRSELSVGGTQARRADELAGPRELWPWLIAGALALLTLEWFVYAQRVRV